MLVTFIKKKIKQRTSKNTFEVLSKNHPGAANLQKKEIETLVNVSLKKNHKITELQRIPLKFYPKALRSIQGTEDLKKEQANCY